MCGFAGFYHPKAQSRETAITNVKKMSSAINHRGPDDSGVWISQNNFLALSHQRLSIIDISAAGHQPMKSSSGRFTLVFNGEIYNFKQLKSLLQRTNWNGRSDTEVLLEAIEQWGLVNAIKKCDGMFALALYDDKEKALFLARDRLGEKPLFYGWNNNLFFFGSELKALKAHPSFKKRIDMSSVTLYFNHGYIPAPQSIYDGILKLLPGSILTLSMSGVNPATPNIKKYWDIGDTVSPENVSKMSNTDLVNELDKRLNKVITQESIADVPLGSFLSGGIDSALVTAMLQRNSMRKVETFSLGFEEKKYNEAEHAKKVADHIGTNHHELIVAADDMQDIVPLLPAMFDEPFGDPSAIPTFIVSKFAKSNVTVALTGDGGDELFCGYNHYHRSAQIWSSIQKLPYSLREFSADMLHPLGVKFYSTKHGRKLERLSNYLKCKSMHDCYKVQVEASDTELENLLQAGSKFERIKAPEILQDYDAMMFSDIICYLPDDILAKVDRASMSVSLETRAPFLNHNIVDFAYRLPINCKVKSGNGKLLLRKLLENYIPRNLFERPKMGFGLPIDEWLRGPLRHWAETLLSESNLNEIGFLRTQFIRNRWSLHISGNQNWHYFLWDLLMFLEWYQND